MLDWLWDVQQDRRINEAASAANSAQSKASRTDERLGEMQRKIDALALAVMALSMIAKERLGLSETELDDRIREIDLSDGKLDGKFMGSARRFTARSLTGSPTAVGPRKCVNCDRTIGPQHETCFYCGGALLPQ